MKILESTLVTALIPLAKKAKIEIEVLFNGEALRWSDLDRQKSGVINTRNGTLEGEVELVLGWLAKAGYSIGIFTDLTPWFHVLIEEKVTEDTDPSVKIEIGKYHVVAMGNKATLNAAVAAAVLTLYKVKQ